VKATALPSLEGLDNLGRRNGVDIRPTLVRVLTDLYVQKPLHTSEEEQHYTELVLRLIEAVDISTRAIVARKLANYAGAPIKVVRRLARDVPEVAEPVLINSPCLSGLDLLEIINEFGPNYALMIARRTARGANSSGTAAANGTIPDTLRPAKTIRGNGVSASAPEDNLPPPAAETDIRLGELFLVTTREERRVILSNLSGGPTQSPAPTWVVGAADVIRRLEAHAMGHHPEAFTMELAGALGFSGEIARRVVGDSSGEPLLVALKALDMPSHVLLRVLLFLNPAVGHSVDRVFDLVRLYDQMLPEAAIQLVNSLREAGRGRPVAPSHQPILAVEEAERVNRHATGAARRQLGSILGSSQARGAGPSSTARVTEPRDRAGERRDDPRLR
jgi:hypothetical protein